MTVKIDDPAGLTLSKRLGFLAKDSLLYGGAGAISKAFALITFPLLARHLSVEEYGALDFFTVLGAFLTIMVVFGQDSAVARYFYEFEDAPARRRVISESLAFQVGIIVLLLPPTLFLAGRVAPGLIETPESARVLRLVVLQVPFLVLINFAQNLLKWTFQRRAYLLMSLGMTGVTLVLLLIGVLMFDVGVPGIITIYLMTQVAFGALGIWLVRSWLRRPDGWRVLGDLLRYAVPFGVICAAGAAVPALERSVISEFLGSTQLGIYAAGAKIGMLMALPVQAFQVAWGPFSLSIFREADASETYNAVLKGFSVAILVGVLALVAVAEPAVRLLASDRYAGASVVVFALAFGLAVEAVGWITGIGITLSKKSYLNLYSYLAFLGVSVAAMALLLQPLGMVGVAWGAALGRLAKALVETWLAQRAHPLDWHLAGVGWLAVLVLGLGLLSNLAHVRWGPLGVSATAVVGLVVVIAVGWWGVFTADERTKLLALVGAARPLGRGA